MNLTDEAIKAATAKAIIDTLTTEKRDELVRGAIESLLNDKASDRYNSPTKLQAAFNDAVKAFAFQMAKDELEKPENREQLSKVVADGVKQALCFDDPERYESIQNKIAMAVERGMTGERY